MRSPYLWALLLAVATVLLYLPTGQHEFVIVDDGTYVYGNPHVRQGLGADGVAWAFRTFRASNWHPLTWLSHMLDVSLFGLNAGAHHLVGASLHALAAALLLILLHGMTGAPGRSAFVATLFALHPLRVESVAWAAERKDQLATVFFMLTLLAWLGYARRPGAGRYAMVLVMLTLGLMAKPMLVTVPLVLLLLDRWPLERGRWRLLEKLPLFALAAASAVVTVIAQRSGGAIRAVETYPLVPRLLNAARAYVVYLWQTVWPADLTVHYPLAAEGIRGAGIAAALTLVVVTLLIQRARQRLPAVFVGWLWYLGMLVPVIGIVQVGTQAHADRYTYLPSIGLYVAVAWGAWTLLEKHPRVAVTLALATCLACVPPTWRQIRYWRDSVTLFEHAVRVSPDNEFARLNYAVSLLDAGWTGQAERELNAMLDRDPGDPRALFNLGNLYRERGDVWAAATAYRAALESAPDHAPTLTNLGRILLEHGEEREGMELVCRAARLAPDAIEARVNCANALVLSGETGRADLLYREVLALDPANVPARLGIARHLLETGHGDEGLELVEQVLKDDPEIAAAHLLRGMELERRGQKIEACEAYREVLRLDPGNRTARERANDC